MQLISIALLVIFSLNDVLKFNEFKIKQNKSYNSIVEEDLAQFNQVKNLIWIKTLNAMDSDATYAINKYSDISNEAFIKQILPNKYYQNAYKKELTPSGGDLQISADQASDPPASLDWRDQNKVTPVQNQGTLGTCWAFSAAESVEGAQAMKQNELKSFSVEQLVECDNHEDASKGQADCGVFGGWPQIAFEQMVQFGGLKEWKDYPYCQSQDSKSSVLCQPCMAKNQDPKLCGNHSDLYCKDEDKQREATKCVDKSDIAVKVSGQHSVSEDEEEIKKVLAEKGPLSIALNAAMLQFQHSGIFNPFDFLCSPKDLDHAVLLVGQGTEGGKDFWIVKNSWGEDWGEKGQFRIIRGKGKCGINRAVTFPDIE